MSSFIISKLNISNKKINASNFVEKLLDFPSNVSLISTKSLETNKFLRLEISEPVSLNFKYLPEPLNVNIITKSIINFNGTGLMISCPSGIGILTKGGGKKYIDTYIGRIIAKSLFDDESIYNSFTLSTEQMNPNNWGDKLSSIKVNLPDTGVGTISGKDLTLKIKDMHNIFGNIDQGNMISFKVSSTSLNRTVSVSSNGIIKVQSEDILKVFKYIQNSIKPIK